MGLAAIPDACRGIRGLGGLRRWSWACRPGVRWLILSMVCRRLCVRPTRSRSGWPILSPHPPWGTDFHGRRGLPLPTFRLILHIFTERRPTHIALSSEAATSTGLHPPGPSFAMVIAAPGMQPLRPRGRRRFVTEAFGHMSGGTVLEAEGTLVVGLAPMPPLVETSALLQRDMRWIAEHSIVGEIFGADEFLGVGGNLLPRHRCLTVLAPLAYQPK